MNAVSRWLGIAAIFLLVAPLRAYPAQRDHVVRAIHLEPGASRPTVTSPGARPALLAVGQHVDDGSRIDVPLGATVTVASSEDKSTTTLRPGSSLTFRLTGAGERSTLHGGSVVFSVVHGALDFFEVRYGDKFTANAHGTVFSITVEKGAVTFASTSGAVGISCTARLQVGPVAPESVVALEPATVRALDTAAPGKPVAYSLGSGEFAQTFATTAAARAFYTSQLARAQAAGDPVLIAAAFYDRGVVFDEGGDYRSAVADYNEALRLDPNDAAIYYNRALTYDHNSSSGVPAAALPPNGGKDDYARAIALYDDDLKADPTASVYANRGAAYYHVSDYAHAIADYDREAGLHPAAGVTYNLRGLAYDHSGDAAAAVRDYDNALRLYGKDVSPPVWERPTSY